MTPEQRVELIQAISKQRAFEYVDSLLAQARAEALEEAAKICEQLYDSSGEAHTEYDCAATIRARKDGQ